MDRPTTRILCIDDDTHSCEWISIMLKGSGVKCSVTSVERGLEASHLLESQDFDLCILEYALPDMTGPQFCRMMRERGYHVPIMFFTAMNRTIDRDLAFESGATEYLVKPDDLEIFVDEVVKLLNHNRIPQTADPRRYAEAA